MEVATTHLSQTWANEKVGTTATVLCYHVEHLTNPEKDSTHCGMHLGIIKQLIQFHGDWVVEHLREVEAKMQSGPGLSQ